MDNAVNNTATWLMATAASAAATIHSTAGLTSCCAAAPSSFDPSRPFMCLGHAAQHPLLSPNNHTRLDKLTLQWNTRVRIQTTASRVLLPLCFLPWTTAMQLQPHKRMPKWSCRALQPSPTASNGWYCASKLRRVSTAPLRPACYQSGAACCTAVVEDCTYVVRPFHVCCTCRCDASYHSATRAACHCNSAASAPWT